MSRGGAGVRIYFQAPRKRPAGPKPGTPSSAVCPLSLTSSAASWVSSCPALLSWTGSAAAQVPNGLSRCRLRPPDPHSHLLQGMSLGFPPARQCVRSPLLPEPPPWGIPLPLPAIRFPQAFPPPRLLHSTALFPGEQWVCVTGNNVFSCQACWPRCTLGRGTKAALCGSGM